MNNKNGSFGAVFVFAIIAAGLYVWYHQKTNQLRPPLPGQPAPVVPKLPEFLATFSRAKTLCEGHAKLVQDMAREQQFSAQQLNEGRRLYNEAQAEFNGCITLSRSGLVTRFRHEHVAMIEKRANEANAKMMAFLDWADSLTNQDELRTSDSLGDVLNLLKDWMGNVSKANDEAVRQLREDLDRCRLRDWSELGR